METLDRDHLFISYAYEQEDLAMWLALKLSGEGYRVWVDQLELLGGEPFPTDIDRAIRHRAFRVLGLISRDSVDKPNPRGERTLALAVGKALGIDDFYIPLRADGILPEELNFQISDRTYIDFSQTWANGFRRVMKKLDVLGAPRTLPNGREAVAAWYSSTRTLTRTPETLWSNVLEFVEVPSTVLRVQSSGESEIQWPIDWPRVQQGLSSFVFEVPPGVDASETVITPYRWAEPAEDLTLRLRPWVSDLLRQYILRRARGLGLLSLENGAVYFPQGLLKGERLSFDGYKGKTYCLVVGERTFNLGNDRRETVRYHLVINPRVDLRQPLGVPSVRIGIQLYLTYLSGAPLEAKKAHSRRRRICMHWYNHEWLNRVLAAASFLADGKDVINLAARSQTRLVMSGRPHRLGAQLGIDESCLRPDIASLPIDVEDEDEDDVEAGA